MTGSPLQDRVVPTKPRRWKSVRFNQYVYVILALAIFIAAVPLAQANNMWSVSGKVAGTGEKVTATGQDPAEIKGWMTVSEVLAAYKVPKEEFYAQFKLPADLPVDSPLNTVEKSVPGFSVSAVRTWLAQRK